MAMAVQPRTPCIHLFVAVKDVPPVLRGTVGVVVTVPEAPVLSRTCTVEYGVEKEVELPVLRGIWTVDDELDSDKVLTWVEEALVKAQVTPSERRTEAWHTGASSVNGERRDVMVSKPQGVGDKVMMPDLRCGR